jgi:chromosomal replication initiation ATPase DnaA
MELISPYVYPILKRVFLDREKYMYLRKISTFTEEDVRDAIMIELKVDKDFLNTKSRKTDYVDAKKIYCKICTDYLGMKSVIVAKNVNGYDHTVVLYNRKKYNHLYGTNQYFKDKANKVLALLGINY